MRFIVLILLLFPLPALAATGAKQSFNALSKCVQENNVGECREHVTASSVELYDRFAAHGLLRCVPEGSTYLSEKKSGAFRLVRAETPQGVVRLLFAEEEGSWKLDLPETLQTGLGPKWRQRVNATEQIYLLLKAKMGDRMDCGLVRGLAQNN